MLHLCIMEIKHENEIIIAYAIIITLRDILVNKHHITQQMTEE